MQENIFPFAVLIHRPCVDSTVWRSAFRTSADPTSAFLLLLALGTGISMAFGALMVVPVPHPSLSEPAESVEEDEPAGEHDPLLHEAAVDESAPTERTPLKGGSGRNISSPDVSGWGLTRELDFWWVSSRHISRRRDS